MNRSYEIPPLRGRLTARYDDGRLFGVVEGVFSGGQDHVDSALDKVLAFMAGSHLETEITPEEREVFPW